MWLFKHGKQQPPVLPDPVVDEAKRRTHAAADAAQKGADILNEQFVENHITLTILRTAGGSRKRG